MTFAKRDLRAGEVLDGIGGFTCTACSRTRAVSGAAGSCRWAWRRAAAEARLSTGRTASPIPTSMFPSGDWQTSCARSGIGCLLFPPRNRGLLSSVRPVGLTSTYGNHQIATQTALLPAAAKPPVANPPQRNARRAVRENIAAFRQGHRLVPEQALERK